MFTYCLFIVFGVTLMIILPCLNIGLLVVKGCYHAHFRNKTLHNCTVDKSWGWWIIIWRVWSLPSVHVIISPSCAVADLLLYIWKLELPCVHILSVCGADVRMKLSKSTDAGFRASVCFWVMSGLIFLRKSNCRVLMTLRAGWTVLT